MVRAFQGGVEGRSGSSRHRAASRAGDGSVAGSPRSGRSAWPGVEPIQAAEKSAGAAESRVAERGARGGIAGKGLDRARERLDVARGTMRPSTPSRMNSGMPAKIAGPMVGPWPAASRRTFGKPSRSPDGASSRIGRRGRPPAGARPRRAAPWAEEAILSARLALALVFRSGAAAAADVGEAPAEVGRQGGKRPQKVVEPLLRHRPSHGDSAPDRPDRSRREPAERPAAGMRFQSRPW